MAKRGDGVRVLSAFFAGVLLAGTCARTSPGTSDGPAAQAVPPDSSFVWATPVDVLRAEELAREEIAIAAQTYELQEGEPPLVDAPEDAAVPFEHEAIVLAWARARCDVLDEEGEYRFSVRDPVVTGGRTFALVTTPCLMMESGAYNYLETVIEVANGRVRAARFASLPQWASDARYELTSGDPSLVWNPGFEVRGGLLYLRSGALSRGLGDGGEEALFVWRGERFELVELRRRAESPIVPEEIGPFPIVAPSERRCSAALEVAEGERRAAIVLRAGVAERVKPRESEQPDRQK